MEFRVLGPLDVVAHGRSAAPRAAKPRALLALLLLRANQPVSRDLLIEELWRGRPPATAAKTLQTYVSRLRRLLGDERIATSSAGYSIRVGPDELDLHRFERLRATGKSHEALALWRGPPLADFAYEPWAQTEIARLEELRLVALEERLEADLERGRHPELVGELEALVGEHPLRERLRGQLMIALYRSGRQTEALEVYREARVHLADRLGLEPGPELKELERAILTQDPALAAPRSTPVRADAGVGPGEQAPVSGAGVFVGREKELGELLTGLDEAVAGRGRLFLISGEPGIGKSRLADQVATRAGWRDAHVLVGRCWEAGGAPAYWPWVQAIRTYLRRSDPVLLRRQLGHGASDVAQILPELTELFPDLATPPSAEPEGARFRLFDATASFLRSASLDEPVVLLLDDLHAADAPSLLLLQFLAGALGDSRLLVIGTYRDVAPTLRDPLSAALAELTREPVTRFLPLAGLAADDVGSFIASTTGCKPPANAVVTIHRVTEGNPLFVGEVVRLLATEEALETMTEASAWRLTVPEGVRAVIRRRLRHLSESCMPVLVLGAVLGREFRLDALEQASEVGGDQLLEILDEAARERVVTEVPGTPGRLRFAHALIRDTLYEELAPGRRVQLHRRVGEALEALYADNLEPHLAELAHHFFAAVPAAGADRAIEYARRAGDRAAALLAYEEAIRLYEMALGLVGENATRCELLLALGDVQTRAGDTPASKDTFREAARLASSLELSEHLARAALGYGGRIIWEVSRDDEHLVPLLEQALDALGDQDSTLRVRLLARLGAGPLRDARFPPEQKAAVTEEALEVARRIGDPATLAYALAGYISAHHSPEHTRAQLELATELIQVATEAGDKERALEGHEHRSVAWLELGDVAQAKADLEAMARLAEELRQPSQHWYVAIDRALLALLEGRLAEAEELIPAALSLGERALAWHAAWTFRLQLYVLRREQGRLEEVEELIRRSAEEYAGYPSWPFVLPHALAELGYEKEARKAFEELAMDDFAGVPFNEDWLVNMSLLAEAAGSLGDARRAAVLHELLLPYADRVAVGYSENVMGSVSRYLGILASTMSRRDDAVRHFEDALELNGRIGARPWLAHTQENYAAMLLERGEPGDADRACRLLAEARATYRELGTSSHLSRVSAFLDECEDSSKP